MAAFGYERFKNEYMGNFVATCAVTDNERRHCPNKPEHYIERDGVEVGLCNQCYQNYLHGAYREQPKHWDELGLRIKTN